MSDREIEQPEDGEVVVTSSEERDNSITSQEMTDENLSVAQDGETETPEREGSVDIQQEIEVTALRLRVEELEQENSELKDQYLRKQADFENYRKRSLRDREEATLYANRQLLLDLTTVIDDFERAIKSADESNDFAAFHNGVVLIEKQLTGMLERKYGLMRFDSEGEEFDPQKHEAVATEPGETETSIVVQDYQKGYLLHDRVLRAAKVKVSMPVRE